MLQEVIYYTTKGRVVHEVMCNMTLSHVLPDQLIIYTTYQIFIVSKNKNHKFIFDYVMRDRQPISSFFFQHKTLNFCFFPKYQNPIN